VQSLTGRFAFGWETSSGMSRKFRDWQPDASWLFPPSPRDWLADRMVGLGHIDSVSHETIRKTLKKMS